MKKYVLLFIAVIAFAITAFSYRKNEQVRHIVVFKYTSNATSDQIKKATDTFRDLKNKIPGIVSFEHGQNISTEKKDLDFNHIYQITFKDRAARDAYLPHPDHNNFGEILGELSIVEDVFVVDYNIAE